MDSVLNNGKAHIHNKTMSCSIAINEGKIFRIGKKSTMPKTAKEIDLKGLLVLPGLVDAHVHLRDEGKAYKEDFFSGTAAAASGGVTSVIDMPNNDPVTMNGKALEKRMRIAAKKTVVNIGFFSEFPKKNADIEEVVREGAVGFKLFMAEQIGGLDPDDDQALSKAFKTVHRLKMPIAVHAEDKMMLKTAERKLKSLNNNDVEAFTKAHSEIVEATAVKRLIRIAHHTRAHIHFCHVSTNDGLNAIVKARNLGMTVTCEATPHHLFLTGEDLRKKGMLALTTPPLREERHRVGLWNGIRKNWIDIIASDHAPHSLEEKRGTQVWEAEAGIPGLETTLPLLLTEVKHRRLSLTQLVNLTSKMPADILGLRDRGQLKEGNRADLVVVDMNIKYRIDSEKFQSKAKYSPFDGQTVEGKPVKTFVNGQLIMDEGETVAKAGSGGILRRR